MIFKYFFHIASYQIFKNGAILINHESFFQGKNFLQLDRFQFLEKILYWLKLLKSNFSKQNFYKQIANFENNWLIFKYWKRSSYNNNLFNKNIAILESKIMYFYLRPNFPWPNYLNWTVLSHSTNILSMLQKFLVQFDK